MVSCWKNGWNSAETTKFCWSLWRSFFPMDVERTASHIIEFTSQIIQVLLWNTFFQVWVYLVVFKGKNIWSTDPDSQHGTSDPPPAISLSKRLFSSSGSVLIILLCRVCLPLMPCWLSGDWKRSDDKTLGKKMWVKISCEPKSGVSEWRLRIYWVVLSKMVYFYPGSLRNRSNLSDIFFTNGLKLQPPAIVYGFPDGFCWNVATCCWFLRKLQVTTFPFCWMGSHRKTIQSDPRWRPTTANLSQLSTSKNMWRVCEIRFDQRKTWFTPNHFDPHFSVKFTLKASRKIMDFQEGFVKKKPWQVGFGLWSWQHDRKMAWSSSSKLSLYWQIARKLSYGTDCFFDSVLLSLRWCNSEYIFDKFAVYTHFLWHFPCIFAVLFQCFCPFLLCFCCDLHWPAYDFWMPWSWGLPEILGDDFLDMDLSKELHPRSMVLGYLVCSMCFEM